MFTIPSCPASNGFEESFSLEGQPRAFLYKSSSPGANIKILHIAAFNGNLGDNANHVSFYSWFHSFFPDREMIWERLDIRDVWRSDRNLGRRIMGAGTRYDLIVFGGGNFWEMWDETSRNGTSLNVLYSELKDEGLPVLFNALGCEIARGVSENARHVFFDELAAYSQDEQFFVSLRNDGSFNNLVSLGIDVSNFTLIPDHAFFLPRQTTIEREHKLPRVLLNLASDLKSVRYKGPLTFESFIEGLAAVIADTFSKLEFELELFSQIPSDIEAGQSLISRLPESMVRSRVSLSFPNSGDYSQLDFLQNFESATMVVAQRFHSNIIGLIGNADVISISNHEKVTMLHEEIETREKHFNPINGISDFEEFAKKFHPQRLGLEKSSLSPEVKFDSSKVVSQRLVARERLIDWLAHHGWS